jgi:hypothetical protein
MGQLLPYDSLLVPFAYFFYFKKDKPDADQRKYLEEFFWRMSLSFRYSSSSESRLAQDIKRIDSILNNERPDYSDIEEARKAIEESYWGCHTSVADYAQELTEDTGNIPSHLEMYIDYERMGRDMELGGDIFTIETGYQEVHIFWSH